MARRPIYYDTETTGTRSDKDRVIEIAALDPWEKREFVQLVNPGCPIPQDATAIHGISDEMVKDAGSWKEVGTAFAEFCRGDVVLIAHNNDTFDKLFLENEYKRAQLEMPKWHFIDSLKWSRKYRSDLPRHTLQSLREVYQIPANQAHRALDDVIVLSEVFSRMIDDLTLEQVMELLATPSQILRMPFGKHQGKPLASVPADYVAWLKDSGSFTRPENQELKAAFEKLKLL